MGDGSKRAAESSARREQRELAEYLADHDGVITRSAALGLGLSSSAIGRLVEAKLWIALGGGAYLSATHTFTDEARLRAATGATGGAVDGAAAAWWHGIAQSPPDSISLTVPRSHRRAPKVPYDLEVHRRDLLPADLDVVRGLSVTAAPLTALESAAVGGSALLDRSLQEGIVTVDGLAAATKRNAGRHGMAEARRLLAVIVGDAESEAERLFQTMLELHHLTGWRAQFPFGVYSIDFAFPAQRLAIEVDGWAFHRTPDRAMNDARKQNRLVLAGWRVLRFGWHQLDGDGEAVMTDVITAVNAIAA
ncbi:type IV toxin-antitoxin system AbiEi family antitoxin domain-containing protein [Tsukamurella pseudospumae]|uniref:DUF559 domain-containing protein n=1 Tax=Tsukamurella pseudospumae TaxID=239498 RepID=A0A137ZY95_9ACTN|nr:type IV toxin-antitoxin system AbiEi family antitoxin domain-containing protein [Tsukamurella pseudospumae]KXP03142.1 hypothetical protein AXK60_14855 [Tsukamurella pseudospumae]